MSFQRLLRFGHGAIETLVQIEPYQSAMLRKRKHGGSAPLMIRLGTSAASVFRKRQRIGEV